MKVITLIMNYIDSSVVESLGFSIINQGQSPEKDDK